jgi:hypothetical protein
MITIIDTRFNKSFVTECYSTAGDFIGISGRTLSRWHKVKTEHRHELIERFNQFIIYFDTEILKTRTGFNL